MQTTIHDFKFNRLTTWKYKVKLSAQAANEGVL